MDNVIVVSGTQAVNMVRRGELNLFPRFQRHEAPSRGLAASMLDDAQKGELKFLVPVRKGDVGDGAQRLQVLMGWEEEGEKKLLELTTVILAKYNVSLPAFVDLYFRLNRNHKRASGGDLIRGYGQKLNSYLRKFAESENFSGQWKPFAKRNEHWELIVAAYYGAQANHGLGARGGELVRMLTEGTKPKLAPQTVINRLSDVYNIATSMRSEGARATTKAALALLYRTLDQIKNTDPKVLASAFEQHRINFFNAKEKNLVREVEPSVSKQKDFLACVRQAQTQVQAA
jgi:hypothetical protein